MNQYQFNNQISHENEEYIRLRNQNQEVQEVKKKKIKSCILYYVNI